MNALAAAARTNLRSLWETPHTVWGELATIDHKKIGKRYLVTAMVFLLIGGIEAVMMRLQLSRPGARVLPPEVYNQFFTMHGVTMILWYALPILSGFGNYLVPLMIGARDMAFPLLNAFSYWVFLLSGIFLYLSVLVGQAPMLRPGEYSRVVIGTYANQPPSGHVDQPHAADDVQHADGRRHRGHFVVEHQQSVRTRRQSHRPGAQTRRSAGVRCTGLMEPHRRHDAG